jgi:hypothetical protein
MHHLKPNDNLETMRLRIAEIHDRPCFLASGQGRYGTHYRKPGAFAYEPMKKADLFFSHWWDQGRCVRREDRGEDQSSLFYYDLELAPTLRFYIPTTRADRAKWRESKDYTQFKAVGLFRSRHEGTVLWDNDLPKELEPFTEMHRHSARKPAPAVQFLCSDDIATPIHKRMEWHLAAPLPGVKFRTIQAPGQYNDHNLNNLEDVNRMARVDCDPGPCVVCRGAKGERVHLAPLYVEEGVFPTGHICRGCTVESFAAWQALLDGPC